MSSPPSCIARIRSMAGKLLQPKQRTSDGLQYTPTPRPSAGRLLLNVGGWEEVGYPHTATTLISLQHPVQQPIPRLDSRIHARSSHLKEIINTVSFPWQRHITKSLSFSLGVVPSRGRSSGSPSPPDLAKRILPASLSPQDFHFHGALPLSPTPSVSPSFPCKDRTTPTPTPAWSARDL